MSKRFRIAYVIEKGRLHNESALEPYALEIKYLLTGTEEYEQIGPTLLDNFLGFDQDLDVIIPTGRVISSFVLGYIMGFVSAFSIGIYADKDYKFVKAGNKLLTRSPK
ncbi:hypothetical protein KA005_36955 [bacterium]|nr:hypothetical protein [bacterium]